MTEFGRDGRFLSQSICVITAGKKQQMKMLNKE
jgi:hypothetical protein